MPGRLGFVAAPFNFPAEPFSVSWGVFFLQLSGNLCKYSVHLPTDLF